MWFITTLISSLALVFGGCCSNSYFLERVVRAQPEAGDLMTAAQFLFISIEGAIWIWGHPREIRKWKSVNQWLVPAGLYFVVCVLNNRVWAYSVSVPVHTVVRSSSTLVSMLIGMGIGRKYARLQIIGVLFICAGTAASTLLGHDVAQRANTITGLGLLCVATVLASVQTYLGERMKAGWRENLFMTHAVSLPLFLLFSGRIADQWRAMPRSNIGWLFFNVITQYLCVRGVSQLISVGALTVTVTLAIRKFVSLLLSAFIFGGVGIGVLIGGLLVGLGAIIYSLGSGFKIDTKSVTRTATKSNADGTATTTGTGTSTMIQSKDRKTGKVDPNGLAAVFNTVTNADSATTAAGTASITGTGTDTELFNLKNRKQGTDTAPRKNVAFKTNTLAKASTSVTAEERASTTGTTTDTAVHKSKGSETGLVPSTKNSANSLTNAASKATTDGLSTKIGTATDTAVQKARNLKQSEKGTEAELVPTTNVAATNTNSETNVASKATTTGLATTVGTATDTAAHKAEDLKQVQDGSETGIVPTTKTAAITNAASEATADGIATTIGTSSRTDAHETKHALIETSDVAQPSTKAAATTNAASKSTSEGIATTIGTSTDTLMPGASLLPRLDGKPATEQTPAVVAPAKQIQSINYTSTMPTMVGDVTTVSTVNPLVQMASTMSHTPKSNLEIEPVTSTDPFTAESSTSRLEIEPAPNASLSTIEKATNFEDKLSLDTGSAIKQIENGDKDAVPALDTGVQAVPYTVQTINYEAVPHHVPALRGGDAVQTVSYEAIPHHAPALPAREFNVQTVSHEAIPHHVPALPARGYNVQTVSHEAIPHLIPVLRASGDAGEIKSVTNAATAATAAGSATTVGTSTGVAGPATGSEHTPSSVPPSATGSGSTSTITPAGITTSTSTSTTINGVTTTTVTTTGPEGTTTKTYIT